MFAVITPALMTGAFADRLRFAPYLLFISLWIVLVYAPFCHWIWGPGGWMGAQTTRLAGSCCVCELVFYFVGAASSKQQQQHTQAASSKQQAANSKQSKHSQ